jgi:DNA-binding NarL/FixJ family response regulator
MSITDRIRVLVVHSDAVSLAGLSATFRKCPEFAIVNSDDELEGEPFLHQSPARWQADVVVADYEHGIDLADQIARYPASAVSCKVMIVASKDREWEIRRALERGVRGYLLVGCALTELAVGVHAVHKGLRHLSAGVAQRLAESLSGESLTPREESVLRLIVDGMGNKAIAKQLDIAVGTVKSHVKGVFNKLNVESRTQAVAAADRRGILCDAQHSKQCDAALGRHSPDISVNRPTLAPSRRFSDTGMTIRQTRQSRQSRPAVCMN